jgi:hypothetical protein
MHIAFFMIIGLLLGFLIYTVFSHRNIFKPMLLGGGISGLLAGLVSEAGFQTAALPDFAVRLLTCVILSTIFWPVSFLCGFIIGKIFHYPYEPFAFMYTPGDNEMSDSTLQAKDPGQNQAGGVIFTERKEKLQEQSGTLGIKPEPQKESEPEEQE